MSTSHDNNLFYAPKEDWVDNHTSVEIKGQEAVHISKVLRYKVGDGITVADGVGNHWSSEIISISKKSVFAEVKEGVKGEVPTIKKVMAFGAIKKRDRLEFAIEKAVELGAWEICIFDADHSERSRLNEVRIIRQITSAFKQSRRFYFPELVIKKSLDEVVEHYKNWQPFMAYLGDEMESVTPKTLEDAHNLLLVGPEGGFSNREADLVKSKKGTFVSLGKNRLRAETAVAAFLAQFLDTK